MPTRRRLLFDNKATTGGGGGPAPSASLAIGPDFGEGAGSDDNTFTIQAAIDLDSLAMVGNLGVNTVLDLDSISMTANLGLSTALTGTADGPPFWQDATTQQSAVTSITAQLPNGVEEGDLLLLVVGATGDTGETPDIQTPTGYTEEIAQSLSGTNNIQMKVFYKIATASESNVVVTVNTSPGVLDNTHILAELHRVIGVDNTTPIDVSASDTLLAADLDTDPNCPAVTTTVADTRVFAILYHSHGLNSESHTPPANHVERTDFERNDGGFRYGMTTSDRVFASTGDTGDAEVDCTEAVATDAIMMRVAVAPDILTLA